MCHKTYHLKKRNDQWRVAAAATCHTDAQAARRTATPHIARLAMPHRSFTCCWQGRRRSWPSPPSTAFLASLPPALRRRVAHAPSLRARETACVQLTTTPRVAAQRPNGSEPSRCNG
eukprot:6208674-Pleurochrysis_carterae.AAC.1